MPPQRVQFNDEAAQYLNRFRQRTEDASRLTRYVMRFTGLSKFQVQSVFVITTAIIFLATIVVLWASFFSGTDYEEQSGYEVRVINGRPTLEKVR